MKRFLWLMCIGCCTATFAVACGDDDGGGGGGGMEDGGVTIDDINNLDNQLTGLEGELADLEGTVNDAVDSLTMGLDGANDAIDGLDGDISDLQSQIEDLITPDNCTDEELCVPNGVQATAAALTSLMNTVCAKEFDCCDENERAVRLGAGVEDEGDCVKRMVDMIENGQSPDIDLFWDADDIIDNAVQVALAINSNDVQVGIDADKIAECEELIQDIDCNGESEEGEEEEFCEPTAYEDEEDPCSAEAIVIGLQDEGEVCGVTGVDECAAGLRCRHNGYEILAPGPSLLGICMPPSAVGDACANDYNCDGEEQYCDQETNTCAERGDEGDDCEYIDPSFQVSHNTLNPQFNGWLQNPGAMKKGCKTGLSCDPVDEVCVDNCSEHTLCWGNYQCPEDTICNFTEVSGLWDTWGMGICTDPIEEGDDCSWSQYQPNGEYLGTECETERCEDSGEGPVCVDKRSEDGEDCDGDVTGPNPDSSCASTWCDGNQECATLCTDADHTCPDDTFCDTDVDLWSDEVEGYRHPCEPVGETGDACTAMVDTNDPDAYGTDIQCATGRCNTGTGLCDAKLGNAAVCTHHGDCPAATHFCGYNGTTMQNECTPFLTTGCTLDTECGPGSYCRTGGTCTEPVEEGDECDAATDLNCEAGLTCAVFPADPDECHEAGAYPNGASCAGCAYDSDDLYLCNNDLCDSGFCNTANGSICEDPIEGGEDCDADDPAEWRCEDGYYCKHDPDAEDDDIGKGKCTRQRSVGQSCEPRYDQYGNNLLNVHDCQGENDAAYGSNNCQLIGDEFVCGMYSYDDTIMCDGED